jgi:flagellar hook-length control protein FliK
LSQGGLLGGRQIPLDLIQFDTKQTAEPAELTLELQPDQETATDPNALASLVAQALASYQPKTPAAAAGRGEKDATVPTGKVEKASPDGREVPFASADDKPQIAAQKTGDGAVEAAGIADGGKMLPLEAVKKGMDSHRGTEALPEQFGDKLAAAQQAMAQQPSSRVAPTEGSTARIDQPVGASGWGAELGQKVVWMVGQQKQTAELQLNPPNLGPLEVRISINQDQMSATFVSHHAAVREAIEAAIPRLRDMLADGGIALGNVAVGAESFAQQQQQQQQASFQGNGGGQGPEFSLTGGESESASRESMVRIERDGLVNTFV